MSDIHIRRTYQSVTAVMSALSARGKRWMKLKLDSDSGVHFFHADTIEDMVATLTEDDIEVEIS